MLVVPRTPRHHWRVLSLTFDTSAVIDVIRGDAGPSPELIQLIRAAVSGRVDLKIASGTAEEMEQDRDSLRREVGVERLKMFPVLEVPAHRVQERNEAAAEMMRTLFSNAREGSTTYAHNWRDCQLLAAHQLGGRTVFVTLDTELLKKKRLANDVFGVVMSNPAGALKTISEIGPSLAGALPSLAVRPYTDADELDLRRVLAPLAGAYPDFESWLTGTLANSPEGSISLGMADGRVAAVAISKRKDSRVVKLSAFRVDDQVRGSGLGPHLLFQQVRGWVAAGYELAYVTMDLGQEELGRLFQQAGFMVQGITSNRYRPGSTEVVLSKHLIRRRIEEHNFGEFGRDILSPLLLPPRPRDRGPWADTAWWQPPQDAVATLAVDAAVGLVKIIDGAGVVRRELGPTELEVLFHPLRLALSERRALLIPIRQQWADRLMDYPREQLELLAGSGDKLLLRSDNAYYCFPKCLDEVRHGAPILFYVSAPVKAIVGEAHILQFQVDYPNVLHGLFGELGIYSAEQIADHAQSRGPRAGMALALRFGLYLPFQHPVSAATMNSIMGSARGFAPQGLHPIFMPIFEALRTEGGLGW